MKSAIKKFTYTLRMWLCTILAFVILFVSAVIVLMTTLHPDVV